MNNDATEAALGLLGLNAPPPPIVPLKRKQPCNPADIITNTEAINCICGFLYDDGFSIACDDCERWCHAACFDIVEGEVPEEWRCWVCVPRPVDRERAVRLQKARQKQAQEATRKVSPGVERKSRHRASASAIEGGKRRRRASINVPSQQQIPPQPSAEDELVDIDEPCYVPITKDIVPHQETRDRLRKQAQHWRGVTALSPIPLPENSVPAPTTIQPLPMSSFSHPTLSSNTNPSVRPPSYAMHTTAPIPSSQFITPYTSTITPSSMYLGDPLNSYAHLGMPKPFVHLVGPPLDVALDSRITGDESRFVRSGCRPNAVLRPVICPRKDDPTLTFGVFALRDLKAHEEVVLGWEWDDGNAIHSLPALIESPHMFPPAPLTSAHRPVQRSHIRSQMAGILHGLSSTFTTCACGSSAKDCALAQMAAFVDGEDADMPSPASVDLGPLVGVERGFRTREKVPFSGGMSGVEMDSSSSSEAGPSRISIQGRRSTVHDVAQAFRTGNAQRRENFKMSSPNERKNIPLPVLTLSPATASPTPKKDRKGKGRAFGERPGEEEEEEGSSSSTEGANGVMSRSGKRSRHITIDSSPLKSPLNLHRRSTHLDVVMRNVEEEEEADGIRREEEEEEEEEEDREEEVRIPLKMRKRWMHQTRDVHGNWMNSASPNGSASSSLGSTSAGERGGSSDTAERDTSMESERMDVDEVTPASLSPDPKEMPPPPMPAFLDPTTISSTDHHNWPANSAHDAQASPSTSFANLSLLSPVVRGPSPTSTLLSSYPFPPNRPVGSPASPSPPPPRRPSSSPSRDVLPLSDLSTGRVSPPRSISAEETRESSAIEQPDLHLPSISDSSLSLSGPTLFDSQRVRFTSPEHLASFSPSGASESHPVESHDQPTPQAAPSSTSPPANGVDVSTSPSLEAQELPTPAPAESPLLPEGVTATEGAVLPPPTPKVKLSLKDFALRKKKKREEEMAKVTSPSPSTNTNGAAPLSPQLDHRSVGMEVGGSGSKEMEMEMDSKGIDVPVSGEINGPNSPRDMLIGEPKSPPGQLVHQDADLSNVEPVKNGISCQDEQMSDSTIPLTRRRSPEPKHSPKPSPRPSLPPRPPNGTTEHHSDKIASASLQAKVELLDEPIPNGLVSADERAPDGNVFPPEPPPPPLNGNGVTKVKAPLQTPPLGNDYQPLSRRPSQEDGEIVSIMTPPKQPSFISNSKRSHTPPTQPRSFHATPVSPSVSTPSPAAQPRRPTQPQSQASSYRPQQPNLHIVSRPLPSGPRALRTANPLGHSPTYLPSRSTLGAPQFIPRGPSADRDRLEWERERGWSGPTRARGRGGSGWAR